MPITKPNFTKQREWTDEELIAEIEKQRSLMSAVATGGPKIDTVNSEYIERRNRIAAELRRRSLADPNPHGDLWAWYGRWSAGDLRGWASRRAYPVADVPAVGR